MIQLQPLFLNIHTNFHCPQQERVHLHGRYSRILTWRQQLPHTRPAPHFPLKPNTLGASSPVSLLLFPFLIPTTTSNHLSEEGRIHMPGAPLPWGPSSVYCDCLLYSLNWGPPVFHGAAESNMTERLNNNLYSMHSDTFWLSDHVSYSIWTCSQILWNGEREKLWLQL